MKLAAIGSNCIDFYVNQQGGTAYPGGGPVNMAVYTCRLGGQASYTGPIGDDANGRLMLDAMKAKGIDTSHVRILPGRTAVTQVRLENGERVFGKYDQGVLAGFRLTDSDLDFIAKHDMAVSDPWGGAQDRFADLKRRGVKLAFDASDCPDHPICAPGISDCDYLFFSSDDSDGSLLRARMKALRERGPELVTAMLGSKGSLCFDGAQFYSFGIIPCPNLVDTLGAGDSYIAGFLYALAEGRPIPECMRLGAETASETISYFGAWN